MTAHRYSALLSCSVGRRAYVTVTVVILVLFATPIFAATTVVVGSDPTKVVIKGILVTANQVIDGEPVSEGDMITCVAVMGVAPAGATRMTVTDAFIFPGFIGAHNHVAYNFLTKWCWVPPAEPGSTD